MADVIRDVVINLRIKQIDTAIRAPDTAPAIKKIQEVDRAAERLVKENERRGIREMQIAQRQRMANIQLLGSYERLASGVLQVARGLAFLMSSNEEEFRKVLQTILAVQGAMDLFRGTIDIIKALTTATKALTTARLADAAASAIQARASAGAAASGAIPGGAGGAGIAGAGRLAGLGGGVVGGPLAIGAVFLAGLAGAAHLTERRLESQIAAAGGRGAVRLLPEQRDAFTAKRLAANEEQRQLAQRELADSSAFEASLERRIDLYRDQIQKQVQSVELARKALDVERDRVRTVEIGLGALDPLQVLQARQLEAQARRGEPFTREQALLTRQLGFEETGNRRLQQLGEQLAPEFRALLGGQLRGPESALGRLEEAYKETDRKSREAVRNIEREITTSLTLLDSVRDGIASINKRIAAIDDATKMNRAFNR